VYWGNSKIWKDPVVTEKAMLFTDYEARQFTLHDIETHFTFKGDKERIVETRRLR